MNFQGRGFLFSLLIHATFISLIFGIGNTCTSIKTPIVIDLTLLDLVDEPQGLKGGPEKQSSGEGASNKICVAKMAIPAQTPRPEKQAQNQVQKPLPPKKATKTPTPDPSPKVESNGPVPTPSQPSQTEESLNAPPLDAALTANDALVAHNSWGAGKKETGEGASGGGSTDVINRYLNQHFDYIKRIIQQNLRYPQRARRMGYQGKVIVSFIIREDGNAEDITVATSSGFPVLDDNVVSTVKAVTPFPRPPAEAVVQVPVSYRLE